MNIKITPGKTEFSKKILYVAAILNIAVIIFSCIMIYRTENLEPLIYLIPSTAAEVATGTAFYYNKAKAENKIKIEQKYGIKGDIGDDN
nr:MAG TPA: hypothetical protein [Caudoviricetes sp.]